MNRFNPKSVAIVLFILVIAILRTLLNLSPVLGPLTNFTPLGAMALFGGAYFNRSYKAYAFPLAALLLSDLILMQTAFKGMGNGYLYHGWYWVYGAFALMVLSGKFLLRKINVKNIVLGSVAAAFIHWLVSDIGVWLAGCTDVVTGERLPLTVAGLTKCLYQALPYLRNMLTGTLVYSGIFFGAFEWMKSRYPVLQIKTVH